MNQYETNQAELQQQPKSWLITGAAGFIGANLAQTLLQLGQNVVGLDNLSTGYQKNLDSVKAVVTAEQWARFEFINADIRDLQACQSACQGKDYVSHQAALGSVPRSLEDPIATHDNNINGTLNMMVAARDAGVSGFVYASSSSVYGDHPELPKLESKIGDVLSPYAATKKYSEIYADVFARCYDFPTIGLRYFNVFGAYQDPDGAYAAVIPKWVAEMLAGEEVFINGDGETSRDFCYINNCVQANILAATTQNTDAKNKVYNVAVGQRTTLNELFDAIKQALLAKIDTLEIGPATYRDFRPGDVRHSLADISQAETLLGYQPTHTLSQGLEIALNYYIESSTNRC